MEDDEKDDTNPQGMKERKNPEWMKYEKMKLEEKRKLYKCRQNFVMLKDIDTWTEYFKKESYLFHSRVTKPGKCVFPFNKEVNDKVSLWQGDITTLEIDAIVNAANNTLLGGGGVDGCIHRAAGPSLKEECRSLNGCETGQAKISLGHRLPAKFILHTVGPVGEQEKKLESCYKSCLELCLKHDVRSVAFCCISTGIFGYPNERAAEVALRTTRQWLEENKDAVDRIIFCLFMDVDIEIYQSLMLKYYPPTHLSQDSSKNEQIEDTDQQATNTQENTPENTQGNTPENTSENTPENTSENISENTPENTSENAPGNTPENTSETTPENTSENTPGNTSENISENTPENASENTPENTSENTPENTSENTPESPSENIPENKSKKLKQDNDQETDRSQEEMKNASSEEDTAEGHITTPMHVDKPSEEKESLVSTTTTEEQNLTATAETQETAAETTDMDCQLSQE